MNTEEGCAHFYRRVRVLIADNSDDFVWLLVQFLSRYPEIEIVGVAHDGKQAIEMVRQTNPDILLLDIVMPGMDGLEALREIRNENKEIIVYIMSAIDIPQLIGDIGELGIREYFLKPLDLNKILQAIRAFV